MNIGPKLLVDQYSKKFQQKLGRIIHDLHLLEAIIATKQSIASSADFAEGYNRQATTLLNNTVRAIFKKENSGIAFIVNASPFSVIIPNVGSFNIPGGIVSEIHMGGFPFETTLLINTINGYLRYDNVGLKIK